MMRKYSWRSFILAIGLMIIIIALVVSGLNPPVKAETPLDTIFVTVEDFTFTPDDFTIVVGDTVQWDNILGFHNVVADDNSFTSGPPASAPWTFSHTFNSPGVFAYYCFVHGGPGGIGMSGTITVSGDTPTPTNTSTATSTPTVTATPTITSTPQTPTTTPTAVPPLELFNYLPIVIR